MRARSLTVASLATTIAILGSLLASPVLGGSRSTGADGRTTAGGGASAPLPAATCDLSASTRTCHLWAATGTVSLPGAGSVDIWGYALGSSSAPSGVAQLPGPTLVANAGETLQVVLHNSLAEPTSLAFPGHDEIADDTSGAGAGDSKAYDLPSLAPGTFLYEAGPTANGTKQVAMGLYGALIVRPTSDPTSGYGNAASDFATEELLVVSEIDPALNTGPAGFDMRDYHPTYWLFNGQAHPDIPAISATAGSRVLLRYVNAGLENQSVGVLGMHQTVVAGSGHALRYPYEVVAETIPAGATLDTVATIPAGAAGTRLVIQSAAGHTDNAGATAGGIVAFGGMLALIDVTAPPPVDTDGPATTGLTLSDAAPPASLGVTINATGDDSATGGSDVVAAEWFADATCIDGSGQPMILGGPAAVTVGITGTIDVALAQGLHTIRVHSRDSAGNWGPCAETTMDVQNAPIQAVDTISVQTFDSGTLSGWSKAGRAATTDPRAALKGSKIGLRVDPRAGTGFVVDSSPLKETGYRARFWYDPNASRRGIHTIFEGRTAKGTQVFRIEARRTSLSGTWSIRALVRRPGGMSSTGWYRILDRPHAIELAWKSGTRTTFSLSIDGRVKRSLGRLDTHRYRLESVRLGASANSTRGTRPEYFDEFISTRGSRIGP
jgi:FtsP/CotA-like multicopper oxidase with cupredoxin domain